MRPIQRVLMIGGLFWLVSTAFASDFGLEDLRLTLPPGWKLHQDVRDQGRLILGFEKGSDYVNLFVSSSSREKLANFFVSGAQLSTPATEAHGAFNWELVQSVRLLPESVGGGQVHVVAFQTDWRGKVYYGFARSSTAERARDNAYAFLDRLSAGDGTVKSRSLTGPDYTGKKYYFGWGAAGQGDPSMMQNEVKYDVLHTHDIFTKEIGGNYLGTTLIGYANATRKNILASWAKIGESMTWNDMYVQYSSGHGYEEGLGVDISYNEIRDNALSYPAKEIIIFVMACHSGGLVGSFNDKKSVWEHWNDVGRTLMVFSSSRVDQNSSTGPGTDPSEPNGPNGSAGSAFGYALWKSLIGLADGFVDNVKDNYLSLDEILKYTIKRTKEVGGHTPVSTGVYNASLIMNRVPSREFLDSLDMSDEKLSDQQLMEKIRALDQEWRL